MNLKKQKGNIKKPVLVIYIPVIHKGFLDLLNKLREQISEIHIIDNDLVSEFSQFEPNIAAVDAKILIKLLRTLGFSNTKVLTKYKIKSIESLPMIMINDEVSRGLYNKYLTKSDITWETTFLRWDREKVLSENQINSGISTNEFDIKNMKEAYKEASKSSDWWRQVGAVLLKKDHIIFRTYNKGIPSDYSAYQTGAIRDYLKVGEKSELVSTIHAEQQVISEAAKRGISTKGTYLYITHFPCAICSKLIASSGISKCFFSEGSSNTDGEDVLKSANVKLIKVTIK